MKSPFLQPAVPTNEDRLRLRVTRLRHRLRQADLTIRPLERVSRVGRLPQKFVDRVEEATCLRCTVVSRAVLGVEMEEARERRARAREIKSVEGFLQFHHFRKIGRRIDLPHRAHLDQLHYLLRQRLRPRQSRSLRLVLITTLDDLRSQAR